MTALHPLRLLAPVLLTASMAAPSSAQTPCTLGARVTEHTCFHARFGPFAEVVSTPGEHVTAGTPNVNPVHTEYRVTVPVGRASVVTYRPARTGTWAVFLRPDITLGIRDSEGVTRSTVTVDASGDCPFFHTAKLVNLTKDVIYTFVLGGSTASSVYLVIEKIDDFLTTHGRDADLDGYGDANDVVTTACTSPAGFVPNDLDCDDDDPAIHPGAPETCDAIDQDCDGSPSDVGTLCTVGYGECQSTGVASCPLVGAPTACSATAGAPAIDDVCNAKDDDCDGTVDEGATALCTDVDRPRCVSTGVGAACGCETDLDCGDATSARLCFIAGTDQRCIDGCIDGFGRNGCPEGFTCTSADPASPGTCIPEGEHVEDAGVPRDASASDAGSTPDASSGCGCRTSPARGHGHWGLIVGVLVLFAVRARRRAPVIGAVVLSTALLGACGEAHVSTPEEDAGMCTPVLGEALVAHSCQHATLGPFESVVAAPEGQLPPAASASHHTFQVSLRLGNRLAYVPARDGVHVFFVAPDVRLRLLRGSTTLEANEVSAFSCSTLSRGFVVRLESEHDYVIAFEATSAVDATLFVEHAETFGDEAFSHACD